MMETAEYYRAEIEAIGVATVPVHLLRNAAPLTMQAMQKSMQGKFLAGRARWADLTRKDAFYFEIGIKRGKEGQQVRLERGDLGYSYKLDAIIVCVARDAEIPYDAVKIGELQGTIDAFKAVKNGTGIKLKLA